MLKPILLSRNSRFFFAVMLMLTLLLAACGGGSGDDEASDSTAEGGQSAPQEVVREAAGDEMEEAEAGEGEAYAIGSDADDAAASGEPSSGMQTSYVVNQMPLDRLIIRTVTINLTVEDVSQGSIWLRDLASRKGGFVFSSNTYARDESEFAQITIRVPADQLDSTIQEMREHDLVIQVDSEESTSQDVSQEFVDNEARLEALEETQRRFLALLSEANDVEEILRIEAELTNIRSQIETIKGRQNYLSQMTSYSTVTATLHGDDDGIQEMNEEDDEGFIARIFGDSWDSASGVIEGILTGTITFGIIGLAVLPFVLVIALAGRWVYRRVLALRFSPAPVASADPAMEESAGS